MAKMKDYGRYYEKAHKGQTICTETSPDKSSHFRSHEESLMGREMGGGPQDVSHSVKGTGGVPKYPPARGEKGYDDGKGQVRDNNYKMDYPMGGGSKKSKGY